MRREKSNHQLRTAGHRKSHRAMCFPLSAQSMWFQKLASIRSVGGFGSYWSAHHHPIRALSITWHRDRLTCSIVLQVNTKPPQGLPRYKGTLRPRSRHRHLTPPQGLPRNEGTLRPRSRNLHHHRSSLPHGHQDTVRVQDPITMALPFRPGSRTPGTLSTAPPVVHPVHRMQSLSAGIPPRHRSGSISCSPHWHGYTSASVRSSCR